MPLNLLPPELLLDIVSRTFHSTLRTANRDSRADPDSGSETSSDDGSLALAKSAFTEALAAGRRLASVNSTFRAITNKFMSTRFIAFSPHKKVAQDLRAYLTLWLPDPSTDPDMFLDYWTHHSGESWFPLVNVDQQIARFDVLESAKLQHITVDARVRGFSSSNNPHTMSIGHFHRWFASASLLARISVPCHDLRSIHLRLPCQEDAFNFLSAILANNAQLTSVVVEADAAHHLPHLARPVLHLGRICKEGVDYSPFELFVIRAPVAKIVVRDEQRFLHRLRHVRKLCLAVHQLSRDIPSWQLLLLLFHAAPQLQQIDLSLVYDVSEGFLDTFTALPASLPHLSDMTLLLNQVDARLLRIIQAPRLRAIRLWSTENISWHGVCDPSHFPSLFYVTVVAPGTLSEKCSTLGLSRNSYEHNISLAYPDDSGEELVAYIKPYVRASPYIRALRVPEDIHHRSRSQSPSRNPKRLRMSNDE